MLETLRTADAPIRVGLASSFPPTRCGIGRFASSLVTSLRAVDSSLDIDVVRLNCDKSTGVARGDVTMEIDPSSDIGIRAAIRHLNRSTVAVIQHEYGIWGPDDGATVVDMVAALDIPTLVVLHTVLPDPTPRQQSIVENLARDAIMVVMCDSAASLLHQRYSVVPDSIKVIHHGAHWQAQPPNRQPRRDLITWGLLGPGKGLERSIQAVALLGDLDPPVRYRIVGRTHPAVAIEHGYAYRARLQKLVKDLGVGNVVEFIDRYVSDDELFDLVRRSDIVVVPYDNDDQVSSGVITEGVGLGRPVVATRFPYSEELLGSGAGIVVDHDPQSLANSIRILLEDPLSYRTVVDAAAELSSQITWPQVAKQYSQLIRGLVPAVATA